MSSYNRRNSDDRRSAGERRGTAARPSARRQTRDRQQQRDARQSRPRRDSSRAAGQGGASRASGNRRNAPEPRAAGDFRGVRAPYGRGGRNLYAPPRRSPVKGVLGLLLAVAVVVGAFFGVKAIVSGAGVPADSGSAAGAAASAASAAVPDIDATAEERLAACATWTAQDATGFSDIVEEEGVYAFDLAGSGAELPSISLANLIELANALAPYERAEVPYGFLIMDIETGRGFACNLDSTVYGASSFKVAACAFVGQTCIDTGAYGLSSTITAYAATASGGYTTSGTATLSSLIQSAIVYSSNEAMVALRQGFSDDELAAWLEAMGADGDIAYDSSFPHYTTRDAARIWFSIYQYWDTDSEVAALIEEYCGQTETSFLRDALAGYEGITVRDKAGWNADGDASDGVDYNAICDNGIVTYNGRDYLVCVMLGASYAESTVANAEVLMEAVFSLYEDLA